MSVKKKRKEYNHKEFAVGTKIEYNNKLYEVVKSNTCENCSISSFCSASDNYISSLLIPRDKLLSTLGKCSAIDRTDGTSVVFKEIPKDKYYKIEPLFIDDNPSKLKSVEFDLPNGYVIDKDNSDLDKGIIRFKRKWLTIEEIYKLKPIVACEYVIPSIAINESSRKKIVSLANLMNIARYFNGDWNYNANSDECGYMIAYDKTTTEICGYQVININADTDMYFGNIMFKNEADAQYVIDNPNFRDILDNIFKS